MTEPMAVGELLPGVLQEVIDRVHVPEIRASLETAVEDELALEE